MGGDDTPNHALCLLSCWSLGYGFCHCALDAGLFASGWQCGYSEEDGHLNPSEPSC